MRRHRDRRGLLDHLDGVEDVVLLVAPGADAGPLADHPGATVQPLTSPVPSPREHDAVVLVARDLVSLRRAVTGLANVGRAHRVGVWFEREVGQLPTVAPSARWAAVDEVAAARTPYSFLLLSYAVPVPVRPVLLEVARAAAPSARLAVGWPVLGAARTAADHWPAADPSAKVAMLARVLDQSVDAPPDLVLVARDDVPVEVPTGDHPVLGRPTRVAVVEPDLGWEEWATLSPAEGMQALAARGPASLGAVDDQVINPIGFERDVSGATGVLGAGPGPGHRLAVLDRRTVVATIDPLAGVSDADLPALRELRGVRLGWQGGPGPQAYCRAVAGLAAAGVPLDADAVPGWAGALLTRDLVDLLDGPVDLADRLRREERSVRGRRAALLAHGATPWRRALAEAHGVQGPARPTVSVLLTTRRPDMLPFALRQVARQRGIDLEVVLTTHGFAPEESTLAAFGEACVAPVTRLAAESTELFGSVLNRAAAVATGDLLLKMDDDDWYGPDFAADLLLAPVLQRRRGRPAARPS